MPDPTPSVSQYVKFFWECINPFSKWVLPIHSTLGALDLYHELLPAPFNTLPILAILPAWPWPYWVAVGCIIIAIAVFDGVFWERHLLDETRTNAPPLLNAEGIPYKTARTRGTSKLIAPSLIVIVFAGSYFFLPQEAKKQESSTNPKPTMLAEPSAPLVNFRRYATDPLQVLVVVSITNRGIPSTLKDFHLRVTLKSGREVKTENVVIDKQNLPPGLNVHQDQHIYEKTRTKMIPTGGSVVGLHLSKLIDLGDIGNFRDASIELLFKDAFGNQYECKFRNDEIEDNRSFYVPDL